MRRPATALLALSLSTLLLGGCAPDPIDGSTTGGEAPLAGSSAGEEGRVVSDSTISLEYSLKLADGSTVESNMGQGNPLVVKLGDEQMLPAVESVLVGLAVGESTSVTLQPDQAYGAIDTDANMTVPLDQIPEDARVVGQRLLATGPGGQRMPVLVKEVQADSVVLDTNHPLAGETLRFDLKIIGIE